MEIDNKLNKQRVNHLFNNDIEEVYMYFKNPSLYSMIHNKLMKNLECLSGHEFLDSVGSVFRYIYRSDIQIEFRVEEVENTELYKMIRMYYYSVKPTDYKYNLIYKFYRITAENKTLFSHELIFDSIDGFNFHEMVFNYEDMIECFNYVQRIIDYTLIKTQTESIIIQEEFEKIWKTITDLKKFKKVSPELIDHIKYEGDSKDLSTIIKIGNGDNINDYTVALCDVDQYKGIYIIKPVECTLGISQFILEMRLTILGTGKCLLSLKHIYLQNVQPEILTKLSLKKKVVLKKLLNYFDRMRNHQL